MPGTRFNSWSWKWWPGPESNQRHADFQHNGEPGSARVSRRPGTGFRRADRTRHADRAYSEPLGRVHTERSRKLKRRKGGGASRPNSDRTGGSRARRPSQRRRPASLADLIVVAAESACEPLCWPQETTPGPARVQIVRHAVGQCSRNTASRRCPSESSSTNLRHVPAHADDVFQL